MRLPSRLLAAVAVATALAPSLACTCPWADVSVWLVTDALEGKTMRAKPKDEVLVDVPAGSAGQRWEVVEVDAHVLERTGPPEEAPGKPGVVRIPFKALKPGETTLVLGLHDRKEKGAPPVRTFRVTVQVY